MALPVIFKILTIIYIYIYTHKSFTIFPSKYIHLPPSPKKLQTDPWNQKRKHLELPIFPEKPLDQKKKKKFTNPDNKFLKKEKIQI